jgi:hypothetical protein
MILIGLVGKKYFTIFSVTHTYMYDTYVYTNEKSYFVVCTVFAQ